MSVISITPPFTVFPDTTGEPTNLGTIYIGSSGANPLIQSNQIAIFADSALTIPLAQPVPTSNGYPFINGSPTKIYAGAADYSIAVIDRTGSLIYSSLSNKVKTGLVDLSTDVTGLLPSTSVNIPITPAESAVSAVIVNGSLKPGEVYRYGTNTTPGTTPMTTAVQTAFDQARQAGGAPVVFPVRETLLVTAISVFGTSYSVYMNGCTIKQDTGTSTTLGQIFKFTGGALIEDISFYGEVYLTGNIAADTGEFHHCFYLFDDAGLATIRNIRLPDYIYGTNIRGDVVYVGGLTARPTTGVRFGSISGTNIFRSLLSVAGGEVTGDSIIHDGPVGYRDFDVEPNVGGIYQPSTLIINYVKGGIIQVTSDDPTLINDCCDVKVCDLDFNRIAVTTPGYPSAPGVNAQAINFTNIQYFHIGYLKCRNYNYVPITSGTAVLKSNMYIDVADFSNCCITEAVFNSLVADAGTGGIAYLEIGNLIATLTATTKMCFNGNNTVIRVRRAKVTGGIFANSVPGSQFENITLDCNGAAGNIFANCSGSSIKNLTLTNAATATLLRSCTNCQLELVTGTVTAIEGAGCASNRTTGNCVLNGITYTNALLSGEFLSKAMADANQTLSAVEAQAELIRCTGALTAQRNLVVPLTPRRYSIDNSTTGGFGIQVISTSGTGFVVANGKKQDVWCDSTNVNAQTTAL